MVFIMKKSLFSYLRKAAYKALSLKQVIFIIVLFNSFSILLCALLGIAIYKSAYERLLSDSMASSLSVTSAQISQSMENVEYISTLILSTSSMQTQLSSPPEDGDAYALGIYNQTINNVLNDYSTLFRNNHISYAALFSPTGTNTTNWVLLNKTPDFQLQTAIENGEQRTGAVTWTSATRAQYLLLSRNIREIDNLSLDSLGNLVIAVDIADLIADATQFASTYPDQRFIMATQNGKLLYASDSLSDEEARHLLDSEWGSYQIITLQGHQYFAIKGTLPNYNYQFLSLAPYDEIADALALTLRMLAIILIIGLLLVTYISNRLINAIIRQFDLLIARMESFTSNELELPENIDDSIQDQPREIRALHKNFNDMAIRIRDLVKVNYVNKLLTKDAQLQALRSQISPHFLYNTLETINWRAKAVGNSQISQIVESLGNLLRASLSNQQPLVTLSYELDLVDSFITIQRIRFEDQLCYTSEIAADCAGGLIPPLTIQPLVENAIHYGMEEMTEVCHISLTAETHDGLLEIAVRNEGSQFEDGLLDLLRTKQRQPHGFGIGLLNIDERIRLIFGEDYGLQLTNDGDYAVAILRLPYTTDEADPGITTGLTGTTVPADPTDITTE